jgi:hypothetical protein
VRRLFFVDVYFESIKRELNQRLIYECRCDERLKAKAEGSTRLAYTGLRGGLEHLKIETRLLDERFASVMGECEIVNAARRKFESARQCRFKYCLL